MYTPEMAMHIATFFKRAVRREEVKTLQEEPAVGKESVIVNDLLLTKVWSYHRAGGGRKDPISMCWRLARSRI